VRLRHLKMNAQSTSIGLLRMIFCSLLITSSTGGWFCGTRLSVFILTRREILNLPKVLTSWNLKKAPLLSSASLIGIIFFFPFVLHIFIFSLFLFIFFIFHFISVFSYSSFLMYIHRELVVKNALLHSSLPGFLEDWIDDKSSHCVYTLMQLAKFPRAHLVAGGWYLECSRGFIPEAEEPLFNNLVSSAPEVIELEEEPEEDESPAPPTIIKEVGSGKGKGKGKRVASSQVSTRSYTKASVQRTAAPATTVVGSPTTTPSAYPPEPVPTPSHSGVNIPSVPRKRKAIAPDTSATSSEKSSSLSLIENVDMGDLIEELMRTKVPPPAYRRIQEFLTKVSATFSSFFIHSIYLITLFFPISFNLCLPGWRGPYSSQYQTQSSHKD
jgi:hypothetical protein